MLVVRRADGTTVLLPTSPPLRLVAPISTPRTAAAGTGGASHQPEDTVRHIFSYLPPLSSDWLAADSTCTSWHHAARPLWGTATRRAEAAVLLAASRRIAPRWHSVRAFVTPQVRAALRGPAADSDVRALRRAVEPFVVPPSLIASLLLHDGQDPLGPNVGLYGGSAHLLSAREMTEGAERWRRQREEEEIFFRRSPLARDDATAAAPPGETIVRIPLFAEDRARQVVMELRRDEPLLSGRIVTINPAIPFAPHVRVIAGDWEGFLTLI